MFDDWQLLTSLAITALAAVYVLQRLWRTAARKTTGCAACSRCPISAASTHPRRTPLVNLEVKVSPQPSPAAESHHA